MVRVKYVIEIWANKNNIHNWLKWASVFDTRNRRGYTKVPYIGYNLRVSGDYLLYDCLDVNQREHTVRVLKVNVESVKEAE